MDRRKALKGMGLSLGFVVVTPTIISILQSCKNETQILWTPQFFSVDEGIVIKNLVNLILPKTDDLPGANDVNVHQFIDIYYAEVADNEQQEHHKKGIAAVLKSLNKPVKNITTEDYDALLAKFLKASNKEIEAIKKNKIDTLVYDTLTGLRSMSIWAYKTSRKIGEEVLAYDPIPGVFQGCLSLEEATDGKAWSL